MTIRNYWEQQHIDNLAAKLSGNGENTLDILGVRVHFHYTKTMLNIGVGFGTFEAYCRVAGKTIDALDCAENAHGKVAGVVRNFYRDVYVLPACEYDLITECQVALHLHNAEMERHIKHAIRALRPGGTYSFNAPDWIVRTPESAAIAMDENAIPGHLVAGYMCRPAAWYEECAARHCGEVRSVNLVERLPASNKRVYAYHIGRTKNAA